MKALRMALIAVGGLHLAAAVHAIGPLQFYSVRPCRLADTRDNSTTFPFTGGPILSSGAQRNFPVFGQYAAQRGCGIPTTAKAVAVNATVIGPTNYGYLVLWANGAPTPATSNINFNPQEPALANGAIVKLTYPPSEVTDANFQLAALVYIPGGAAHLVVDVVGYYE